jgi:signal transduction histidine kinase
VLITYVTDCARVSPRPRSRVDPLRLIEGRRQCVDRLVTEFQTESRKRALGVDAGIRKAYRPVNNILQLPPLGAATPAHSITRAGASVLAHTVAHGHTVQFYDDDEFLFDTVAQFLRAGLIEGDRVLVIASAGHTEGILKHLEPGLSGAALHTGQLTVIDASTMLAQFMVGSMPDPDRFRQVLSKTLSSMLEEHPGARIRAFGEMVDILWRDGNSNAAIRLEELWNEVAISRDFALLCAYVMGNFQKASDNAPLFELRGLHDRVLLPESDAPIGEDALRRDLNALMQRARLLEHELQYRKEIERSLREALEEKARVENALQAALQREHEARLQAEANDAFKEVFIGILGHDLRNPLNTILTTSRLMTMRRELAPDSQKRLDRVVSSGVRMQRMIDQILDMARDRLATGIFVTPGAEQDLVPLVRKIIDEIRLAHPEYSFELYADGPCCASVDADRFEQVVSNLLGNAATHGDPERPISVALGQREKLVSLSVLNYGPPIEPDSMPLLFDPFRRVRRPEARSEGLGLGLYIAERIVHAHGGMLEVRSSLEAGTTFEAFFPRQH